MDLAAAAERFFAAYNAKDFETMRGMLAPNLDFAHFNRGAAFRNRDDLIAILPVFADNLAPDRRFLPAERVTVAGPLVFRESVFTGTATADIPNFASSGETFALKLCSVLRFNDAGIIVEWKDHG